MAAAPCARSPRRLLPALPAHVTWCRCSGPMQVRGAEEGVMATPPIVPAGWYTDPVGRHEYRYWDGTDWKPEVSDGGVTAVDPLGPAPPPLPQRTAEPAVSYPAAPAPVSDPAAPALVTDPAVPAPARDSVAPAPVTDSAAPAEPAGAPRRRRKWAVPLVAVATVVVIGLIAGLVTWAPWQSPPLLRPAGSSRAPQPPAQSRSAGRARRAVRRPAST